MQDLNLRVSPRTVLEETIAKLRLAIYSGRFQPGSRLVESQLCAQLGVSRPSLREALRSLQAERLIEIVPNKGPYVPTLSWQDATEIYEARELLEVEAVGRCASRIGEAQLLELKAALEAFERAASSADSFAQVMTAAAFYAIILANCGNRILEEVHRGLLARISFLRSRSMSLDGRIRDSIAEMREIYDTIAARDERRARKAAGRHVIKAKISARKAMDQAMKK